MGIIVKMSAYKRIWSDRSSAIEKISHQMLLLR